MTQQTKPPAGAETSAGANSHMGTDFDQCKRKSGKTNGLPLRRITNNQCEALRIEIAKGGLALSAVDLQSQRDQLAKVLRYRGSLGLGTVEGQALGYRCIAARILELKEQGYRIDRQSENVITDEGLMHPRMARYRLIGEPITWAASTS
jgi:hypothetical protein